MTKNRWFSYQYIYRQIIKYSVKCLPELYYKKTQKNGLYEVLKNNKQNVAKGKQRGVDIKQEDVLQVVVRKTLIG
jgi:hypothetical protein